MTTTREELHNAISQLYANYITNIAKATNQDEKEAAAVKYNTTKNKTIKDYAQAEIYIQKADSEGTCHIVEAEQDGYEIKWLYLMLCTEFAVSDLVPAQKAPYWLLNGSRQPMMPIHNIAELVGAINKIIYHV